MDGAHAGRTRAGDRDRRLPLDRHAVPGRGELEAFHRQIEAASARATADAPLAWLRMEPAGDHADLQLTIWPGGEERHLARAGYHGTPVELLPAA